ncbi:MAG TPA: polyprenyl synthetase family protein, partial [Novosphingobium sp.]|nr:polyprenyl synthetase family protein [Novosphingobium sp.]
AQGVLRVQGKGARERLVPFGEQAHEWLTRWLGEGRRALLGAAVEMGAVLGKVPAEGRLHLRGYARDIGLAFQIADDLLDHEGDEAAAGKALRKDEAAGKQTFLTLLGPDRARDQARMLVEQAIAHLGQHGAEADLLRAIARYIVERDH